jgi:integrase/recombinase XerD
MDQGGRQRFELLVERFTEQMKLLGWSPRTIGSYRSHLAFFVAWLDAETDVHEITQVTPEVLHAWQTHLYGWTNEDGHGLSIATQAARLSVLRSFFRYLVKSDVLLYDPSSGLDLPKRKGILPRSVLSKQEVVRLLAAPDATTLLGLRDRAMLEVLYSTGIRNAELRALQVYDLDLDRGLVRINEGKNAKDRVVPLGRAACAWLREYLSEARPGLLKARAGPETEQTLFLSKNGKPLVPLGVLYPLKKHARAAGIERVVTPHTLRHTFATHLLAGHADIRHIQAMLGHASVATTQIYTRVEVTDLKAVHRRCHPREKR